MREDTITNLQVNKGVDVFEMKGMKAEEEMSVEV